MRYNETGHPHISVVIRATISARFHMFRIEGFYVMTLERQSTFGVIKVRRTIGPFDRVFVRPLTRVETEKPPQPRWSQPHWLREGSSPVYDRQRQRHPLRHCCHGECNYPRAEAICVAVMNVSKIGTNWSFSRYAYNVHPSVRFTEEVHAFVHLIDGCKSAHGRWLSISWTR